MKHLIEIGFLAAAIVVFSGCQQLEKLSDIVHEPVVTSRTNTVNTPVGPIEMVTNQTNWVVRRKAETVAGLPQELGFPLGSLITFVLTSALAVTAAIRGRHYKLATISALDAGNQFKEELKKNNIDVSPIIKGIVKDQKVKGTFGMIRKLLDLI
jgi:hypothetical protein